MVIDASDQIGGTARFSGGGICIAGSPVQAGRLGRAVDPDFGRPLAGLKPIDEPPYYAIQFFAVARKSLGGVRTDDDCQVVRTSGEPVLGLFAAGEVAGMAGGHINGHAALEGTMLGPSLFSGRVSGRVV